MIPMDPSMVAALGFAHQRQVLCTVVGGALDGTEYALVDGTLEVDGVPPVRRRGELTLAAPYLAADYEVEALAEALVAGGVMLRLTWRMLLLDGRVYDVVVGLLRCEQANYQHRGGAIRVQAQDLGQAIADDRFLRPRTLSNASKVAAMALLLSESLPGYGLTSTGVTDSTLVQTTWDEDRAGAVTDIARAMGCWWYWDADGGWVVQPVPDGTGTPGWTVTSDSASIGGTGQAGREQTYNAVVAVGQVPSDSGETTAEAPYAIAYDTDPASPTWWDGPFGHRPRFYSSPVMATVAQCQAAADSLLAQSKGLTRAFTVETYPHPGLEPGDVVALTNPAGEQRVIVDTVSLPLAGGPMRLGVRRVA